MMYFEYSHDHEAWILTKTNFGDIQAFTVGEDYYIYPDSGKKEDRLLITIDQYTPDGDIIIELLDEFYEPSGFKVNKIERVKQVNPDDDLISSIEKLISNRLERFTADKLSSIKSYDEKYLLERYVIKDTIANKSYKLLLERDINNGYKIVGKEVKTKRIASPTKNAR